MLEPSQPPLRFRITSFYELLHRNMRGLQPATKAHNFALQQRRSLIVMLLSWTFPP
jgi:hypothetical protein